MGIVTVEQGLYTCAKCGERLPFDRFAEGGRADSDTGDWFCASCNRCPDCGNILGSLGDRHYKHQCRLPELVAAAGIELTSRERKTLAWLAGGDFETVDTLVALFRRIYSEQPAQPSSEQPDIPANTAREAN